MSLLRIFHFDEDVKNDDAERFVRYNISIGQIKIKRYEGLFRFRHSPLLLSDV